MARFCCVLGVHFLFLLAFPNSGFSDEREDALKARENLRHSVFLERLNEEYRNIRQAVGPSIVDIQVIPENTEESSSGGTGWVYSTDGYIITAAHVIKSNGPARVLCGFAGEDFYTDARIIGVDTEFDIAVLQIDRENLLPVLLGEDKDLEVGDQVFAFGSPLGLNFSMVAGSLSAKGRRTSLEPRVLQIDASINPGHSGSPLVNVNGEVVGMNLAIPQNRGQSPGIGFTLPISMALPIIEQIIQYGEPRAVYLGIYFPQNELINNRVKRNLRQSVEGVVIGFVAKETPAFQAGLRSRDVIVGINDFEIRDPKDLRSILRLYLPGDILKFSVIRDGKRDEIEVQLGEAPQESLVAMSYGR